jgi:protein-disulfide isomerase
MIRLLASLGLAAAIAIAGVCGWQTRALAQTSGFDEAQVGAIEQIMRDYLMENPEILREVLAALEEKESRERAAKVALAIVEHKQALLEAPGTMVLGNPDGDVTLVEFFDYNCGYCRRAMPDLMALLETDKNLRVVLKEFPILSEDSVHAARASVAAARQGKYLDFHSRMLASKGTSDEAQALRVAADLGLDLERLRADMAAPETQKLIADNQTLASNIGIEGTPAYIIGTTLVPGAIGLEGLRQVIEEARSAIN